MDYVWTVSFRPELVVPHSKMLPQNSLFDLLPRQTASDLEPAPNVPHEIVREQARFLTTINDFDDDLRSRFEKNLVLDRSLTRQLVSFQANKQRAAYRWFKYKEAFSAQLVDFLLSRYGIQKGTILDPFCGAGTALFVAADAGLNADGIELLPIGQEIVRARQRIRKLQPEHFARLKVWLNSQIWARQEKSVCLPELRITEGAYPAQTVDQIERYLSSASTESAELQEILRFSLLCVLENVSYTRKDGQYLRWDHRSGRKQGAKIFDKGEIIPFNAAIHSKIAEVLSDFSSGNVSADLFSKGADVGRVELLPGSCLDILPQLKSGSYSAIFTSPPYCNRYDYTRTYALELAVLGVNETELSRLRQEMLSCTVENRVKDLISLNPAWKDAIENAEQQPLLQALLRYLEWCRSASLLNNNGIARMVRGYFYEMACVIAECRRVLRPGGTLIMVNDNVRYAGASISVDLIFSSLAERLGFKVENILVLPNGKGNSSQQMGAHGRDALRKCVYIWKKAQRRTADT